MLGHGDCRHIVLIPGSVGECYSLTIEALNLAQQFQTPVFVASDLDLGMNLWLTDPFPYPEEPLQRGKLLSAEDITRLGKFERYRDVDGDGVCYRTVPGTEHPQAAYFTRGTGHNETSGYSERPEDWKKNLDRLALKLETARAVIPKPVIEADTGAKIGIIAYGSTHPAITEARDFLREEGIKTAYCRLRALPASDEVTHFIERYQRVLRHRAKPRRPGGGPASLVPLRRRNGRPASLRPALQRHPDRRRQHRSPDPRLGEISLRPRLAYRRRRAR